MRNPTNSVATKFFANTVMSEATKTDPLLVENWFQVLVRATGVTPL